MYKHFFKRFLDIILSLTGLVLLFIPMVFIGIGIKIDSPGKVLFFQERIGQNKKTFRIIKFRTMKTDAPESIPANELEQPIKWITRFGKFLRKTSLDELPQLFNILLGDMSFVGPRPVVCSETDLIHERDKYGANNIRPGLTGLAQINGRDFLSYIEKAEFDGEYVSRLSFGFDLYCMVATVIPVLLQSNISH